MPTGFLGTLPAQLSIVAMAFCSWPSSSSFKSNDLASNQELPHGGCLGFPEAVNAYLGLDKVG